MKTRNLKKNITANLLFLLLLLTTGTHLYSQSSQKLIGTWITSSMKIVKITKDGTIRSSSYYWANASQWGKDAQWSLRQDGNIVITYKEDDYSEEKKNTIVPYFVNDSVLYLSFGEGILLRRITARPPSALIGDWIFPQEDGDIEITISEKQMTIKKGREIITKEILMKNPKNEIPYILYNSSYFQEKLHYDDKGKLTDANKPLYYSFIDDTHVFIGLKNTMYSITLYGYGNRFSGGILIKK